MQTSLILTMDGSQIRSPFDCAGSSWNRYRHSVCCKQIHQISAFSRHSVCKLLRIGIIVAAEEQSAAAYTVPGARTCASMENAIALVHVHGASSVYNTCTVGSGAFNSITSAPCAEESLLKGRTGTAKINSIIFLFDLQEKSRNLAV